MSCGRLLLLALLLGVASAPTLAGTPAPAALSYEQGEDRAAFIEQVRRARKGDSEAQWQVAATYLDLNQPARALPMLRAAAESGHARAAARLGSLHEQGHGMEKNLDEAKRWYRLAADREQADAMAALGRLLLAEPAAHEQALSLLQRAAAQNEPNAQYQLGWLLARRGGADEAPAYGLFVKAAQQGHVGAQLAVATHLLAGRGVAADREAAGKWVERAAAGRDPVAHYLLARFSASAGAAGRERAHSAYRVAAEAGHREAQFALAELLAQSAAEADRRQAAEWFARAHEAGHKVAGNRLGELYRDGAGVARQTEKARGLFQFAAEHGNVNAMYNLATMQDKGLGGPRDTVSALAWYARAADAGHEGAAEVVAMLLNSSVKTSALELKGFWQ